MLSSTLGISLFGLSTFLVSATPLCPETIDVAGGGLPNSTLPSTVSESGIREIQLAQFLENLEVEFFTTGLTNITDWGTTGYSNNSVEIVGRIAAQEQVHRESLSTLLGAYEAAIIPPCNYSFPVASTEDFFRLANLIGSAGIGATIGLSERLALTDPMLARLVASILTVESRHAAFFRHVQGEVPNPTPFDTGSNDIWAYNIALSFIVPGSCPVEVPIPALPKLNATQHEQANVWHANSTTGTNSAMLQQFSWDPTQTPFVVEEGKELLVGWVNQVNVPTYTPLSITSRGEGTSTVPQGMNGIAFAVITTQQYDNVNDLAFGTLAGPVVVRVS
ncbi:ferritin-like domain-containing protein [Dendryphion nanum]|uniref:Ferritin-like domain-containing protein n=1 Tax=Dendryphion nanum TaxID=256645 RepID=A0A9P9D1M4_9PLEO|nr:ferritin-like domain-containing protein [Dendryphion nanum]